MMNILAHTPIWVFILFAFLLVFGFMQTRTRSVSRIMAMTLPVGMIALSLFGIYSSFGLLPLLVIAWGVALIASAAIAYLLFRDKRISYDQQTRKFFIPGSWLPFVVIMAIFATKYVYAIMRASGQPITFDPTFIGVLCVAYGIFSGYFASKAINLIVRAQIKT